MSPWPKHPVIYEINTWVWLDDLSRKYGKPVTLAGVPPEEWDYLSTFGFDAVWFMGVWERSPAGTAVANRNTGQLEDFRRALPDFRPEDNVGSPYCVRQYVVDRHLGGREGLAVARKELARRGLKLIVDFVPNHIAPDHPWVTHHPEFFIQGNADDARNDPVSFVEIEGKVFACGRDPYFPAWQDVLQLNAFQPGFRRAVIETMMDIAEQSDGVRCDMAMLLLNRIFERTWGNRSGQKPATEYWVDVISAIRRAHPDFLFMAEAYWDLEWELQQQGFDYCYDKRLYDRLEHNSAEDVRLHLCAELAYQSKLVRFIENHDEPRAHSVFSPRKHRASAVTMATIPGAKLFHEGQFEGRKVRLPVFLSRRPAEPVEPDLQAFYPALLQAASLKGVRNGEWQLCERSGWPDNASYRHLVAWCWRCDGKYCLIVVNLSDSGAQGQVRLPWKELEGKSWQTTDLFAGQTYVRSGAELCHPGLYVDLPAWGFHVLTQWRPAE
jgi:glycosidase